MAAKIGILAEATTTGTTTTTVYTVPADKSARIRILFAAESTASAPQFAVYVGTPGSETNIVVGLAGNIDFYTGIPTTASMLPRDIALTEGSMGAALTEAGSDRASILPLPVGFYLSTGDTVRYIVNSNGMADLLFQVIGVEDDA